MAKYLVLDLDGTVAPIGKAADSFTSDFLRRAEDAGVRIVFCSGKPTYYLVGFARQMGLKKPILIGENGAEIVWGIDLPPAKLLRLPIKKEATALLARLKDEIEEALCERVWFQPNNVELTPFLYDDEGFDVIEEILSRHKEELRRADVVVFRMCDCFDMIPSGIDKGAGLRLLKETERIAANDLFAVGDGVNDVPMFTEACVSVGIGPSLEGKATYNAASIGQALEMLSKLLF